MDDYENEFIKLNRSKRYNEYYLCNQKKKNLIITFINHENVCLDK